MPRRKVPKSLQELALEAFTTYYATLINDCFHIYNHNDDAQMKARFCDDIPGVLFDDFAVDFLKKLDETRQVEHQQWVPRFLVSEILIDDRLTKLERYPNVADHLVDMLFDQLYRFNKLRHLHFGKAESRFLMHLQHSNLKNLTTFGCHFLCTDEILVLLSENCPKLISLDIEQSKSITAHGLEALRACHCLRKVNFKHCGIGTQDLIDYVLSNDKLENLEHFVYKAESLLSFSGGVYPNLKSLVTDGIRITDDILRIIGQCFPGLTNLFLHGGRANGDLGQLRSLTSLSTLGIWCTKGYSVNQLESLLQDVGDNYSNVSVAICDISDIQRIIDFVYKFCKKILHCRIGVWSHGEFRPVIIPPFEHLQTLEVGSDSGWAPKSRLHFSRLLSLQKLRVKHCDVDVISMLLHHDRFPCLSELFNENWNSPNQDDIMRTIKEHNLDVNYNHERGFGLYNFWPHASICDNETSVYAQGFFQ